MPTTAAVTDPCTPARSPHRRRRRHVLAVAVALGLLLGACSSSDDDGSSADDREGTTSSEAPATEAASSCPTEVDEAAMIDGAGAWTRFWRVTLPQLRPTLFTVLTLGLIGTWQVFDQIYTGTKGASANTTLTPAYLSYTSAFGSQQWGVGAAIAFVLFAIIVVFTLLQRWALKERPVSRRRMRWIEQGGSR